MVKEITSSYGSDFLKWEIGLISKCSDHEFIKPDQVAFMWHLVDNQNLCATNPHFAACALKTYGNPCNEEALTYHNIASVTRGQPLFHT